MIPTRQLITHDGRPVSDPLMWRDDDGQPLTLTESAPFNPADIDTGDFSLWRYQAMLGMTPDITLGEGLTPLVETEIDGQRFYAKLEYLNPTGSYKDRGTVTMMNVLAAQGVTEVVEDSSGNAGASVAAYASAAGIKARIFVPESGSAAKKALITALGGELVEVPGPQYAKTEACEKAAETTPYASHAWNPYFVLGQATAGWEIWEQMRHKAPDAIVTPLGHGGLFLGIAQGFAALHAAGIIDRVPRMFGVQAALSDPIVQGYEQGADVPPRIQTQRTVADGIIVDVPVRGREVLAAIRGTGGAAFRVAEDAILLARDALARRGLMVEPTSAVTLAALPQVRAHVGPDATVVLTLTGSGLKTVGR